MDMSQLEKELEKRGRELMRTLLQEHFNNRSPGTSSEPVRDADGINRTQTPDHERKTATVFGRVELNRAGYAEKGCKSLHPLDAELNLPPEIYSLELQRRIAEEAAKNSCEEVVATIAKTTGSVWENARLKNAPNGRHGILILSMRPVNAIHPKIQTQARS